MKGIILAGGEGTRLHPITMAVSKQLVPVYDKPMIYYPLSVLMLAGIREILIITAKNDSGNFIKLLGNGSNFGISIDYAEQENPNGIAEAFLIGEKFIGKDNVCLILGDNIFYGPGFSAMLVEAANRKIGASVFAYQVNNPESFGVIEFDKKGKVTSIQEKPDYPKSNWALTGLYFYDNRVCQIAKEIKPSGRGELEITDINSVYLDDEQLVAKCFGRGFAWLDTGNPDSLIEAAQFVHIVEKRQGKKIACLEEIAYRSGWISAMDVLDRAKQLSKTSYGSYLKEISR